MLDNKVKRIAILGGSFDPVHIGHVENARELLSRLNLDALYFLPCGDHPHAKKFVANAKQRLTMLQIATKDIPQFFVDDYELRSCELDDGDHPTYTIDTLHYFRQRFNDSLELYFIVGSDNLALLHTWREVDTIFSLAQVVVIGRPGYRLDLQVVDSSIRKYFTGSLEAAGQMVNLPEYDISSTELRESLSKGEHEIPMMSKEVLDYIIAEGIYR